MTTSTYQQARRGFTLMETVIAIGVLALLLTGFLAVFAPASAGIRKAVSIQEADRLAFALQKELTDLRGDTSTYRTGFAKGYDWIRESTNSNTALVVYQYRSAVANNTLRDDGTPEPYTAVEGTAGQDFVIQPMVRRKDDPRLEEDLRALEGRVYATYLVQLVFNENGRLVRGEAGQIKAPAGADSGTNAETFPEAVIAFAADFFLLPNSSYGYINGSFNIDRLQQDSQPVFTRNLAIRR